MIMILIRLDCKLQDLHPNLNKIFDMHLTCSNGRYSIFIMQNLSTVYQVIFTEIFTETFSLFWQLIIQTPFRNHMLQSIKDFIFVRGRDSRVNKYIHF